MNLNIHSPKQTSLIKQLFQWATVWLILPSTIWAGGVVTECTEAALRAAMARGGTVTFTCDGTITLAGTLTNAADLTLDGTGHQVTISGSNAVRVFYVPTNVTVSIVNLTVANGSGAKGGGIFNDGGTLNLAQVVLAANEVMTGGDELYGDNVPGEGGAVYSRGGTVNATNCTFVGNVANQQLPYFYEWTANGGALCNENGQVNLEACLLVGNSAVGGAWPLGAPPYLVCRPEKCLILSWARL